MALVDLGTRTIAIGALPQDYAPISFNQRRAYGIFGQFATANFSNIASVAEISTVIVNAIPGEIYHPEVHRIRIRPGTFSFWVPFSPSLSANDTAFFRVERIPLIFGQADSAPEVTLRLEYDDSSQVNSWRS